MEFERSGDTLRAPRISAHAPTRGDAEAALGAVGGQAQGLDHAAADGLANKLHKVLGAVLYRRKKGGGGRRLRGGMQRAPAFTWATAVAHLHPNPAPPCARLGQNGQAAYSRPPSKRYGTHTASARTASTRSSKPAISEEMMTTLTPTLPSAVGGWRWERRVGKNHVVKGVGQRREWRAARPSRTGISCAMPARWAAAPLSSVIARATCCIGGGGDERGVMCPPDAGAVSTPHAPPLVLSNRVRRGSGRRTSSICSRFLSFRACRFSSRLRSIRSCLVEARRV